MLMFICMRGRDVDVLQQEAYTEGQMRMGEMMKINGQFFYNIN